jgi:acyl-CoA reductase-like NAD-dependent aldehyde dehydrogenase
VIETIHAARLAQPGWATLPLAERLRPVRTLRLRLVEQCAAIEQVLSQELRKSPEEALGGDILSTADALAWLERRAPKLLAPRRVPTADRPFTLWGQRDSIYHRPRGVVGIIGTWNYPIYLNAIQIAHALVAGNAVIWKPSEVAPQAATLLANLIHSANWPSGIFNALPPTREGGSQLTQADIDYLVFTGSAAVGRKIATQLADRLIPSTLELSGCDAMLLLDDADLTLAARAAAFGVTLNRGQTCIAVRRVLVPRAVYENFTTALVQRIDPAPLPTQLPAQEEHTKRLLDDALAGGARLLTPPAGPLVLADVRPHMALCREAAFTPILGLMAYDSLEQALKFEAQCPYALSFSIFTAKPSRGEEIAGQLRAGSVCINDVIVPTSHPATPFGGRGQSGWGVTQGAEGLLEMTVPQVVSSRPGTFRPHFDKSKNQHMLLRGLLTANHAPSLWARLGGWWQVIRAALQGG